MNIVGYYNEHGYRVVGIRRKEIRELYTAGNHRQDSQVTVSPATPDAVPLRQIKTFCARTVREIAGERNARFTGVEYGSLEASWLTPVSPGSDTSTAGAKAFPPPKQRTKQEVQGQKSLSGKAQRSSPGRGRLLSFVREQGRVYRPQQ